MLRAKFHYYLFLRLFFLSRWIEVSVSLSRVDLTGLKSKCFCEWEFWLSFDWNWELDRDVFFLEVSIMGFGILEFAGIWGGRSLFCIYSRTDTALAYFQEQLQHHPLSRKRPLVSTVTSMIESREKYLLFFKELLKKLKVSLALKVTSLTSFLLFQYKSQN